jgi:hypothetical protein
MPSRPSIAAALQTSANMASTSASNVVTFPKVDRPKNPAAVALGRLGGSKGGKTRAARLSPEQRKTIAQHAAQARWAKEKAK